jgi:cell division protease FtsH
MGRPKIYSESTAREIDEEIKHIIDAGYKTAQDILFNNRSRLELIAGALLEYETLDRAQVEEIVNTGKFTPPPPKPQSETVLGAPAGTPLPETPPKPVPPKLPGLGTPAPATV